MLRMKYLILLFILIQSASAQEVIVVRHAQAQSNVEGFVNGSISRSFSNPLTDEGIQQAHNTAAELRERGYTDEKIAYVIVSPMFRTKLTAAILMQDLGIDSKKEVEEILLSETNFGLKEYFSEKTSPGFDMHDRSKANDYLGETDKDVQERTLLFLNRLRKFPQQKGAILIVTHGGTGEVLLYYIRNQVTPLKNAQYYIENL